MRTSRVSTIARTVTFADRELEKARLRSELKSIDVKLEKVRVGSEFKFLDEELKKMRVENVRLISELKSLTVELEKLRLRSESRILDKELEKVNKEIKRKRVVSVAKAHARDLAKKYGKSHMILGCMSHLFDITECVPNDDAIIEWYNHCVISM